MSLVVLLESLHAGERHRYRQLCGSNHNEHRQPEDFRKGMVGLRILENIDIAVREL